MLFAICTALALAALGGLGAFAIWWSQPSNEARRLLSESPQKRLGELVAGDRARVRGIARRGAEIKTSPLTQRRCIGYRFVLERLVDGVWRDLGEWVDCATFELRADEGVAHVEGPFLMGLEFDTSGGDGTDLTPVVREAIARLTRSESADYVFAPRVRYREAILEEGDPIWVRGTASLSVDPRGTRDSGRGQPVLPVIRGTVHDPTVLAAADQPGRRSD